MEFLEHLEYQKSDHQDPNSKHQDPEHQDQEHVRVDAQKVISRKEDQVTNIIISRHLTFQFNIN